MGPKYLAWKSSNWLIKRSTFRGKSVVLLQITEGDKRESGREIPPKDMNGRAGVLGGMNNVYYWEVEGEGRRDINLYYN